MYFYPNKNDVFIVNLPDINDEDRMALADLQEALGDDVKVVVFTTPVNFTTVSKPVEEFAYDNVLDFPKVG